MRFGVWADADLGLRNFRMAPIWQRGIRWTFARRSGPLLGSSTGGKREGMEGNAVEGRKGEVHYSGVFEDCQTQSTMSKYQNKDYD